MSLTYMSGFENHHATEAIQNALPKNQNAPQKPPHGLYAELISGNAFTAPRSTNRSTWTYRILPSAKHAPYEKLKQQHLQANYSHNPSRFRWNPMEFPKSTTDFVNGLTPLLYNGDGATVFLYAMNQSMTHDYFCNADGEMLFVLQHGHLRFKTELGVLEAIPGEIVVIPRGIKFQIILLEENSRGYICENSAAQFTKPELGPIGTNGLAHLRHFEYPEAAFEDIDDNFTVTTKYANELWRYEIDHSPCDVVAWHGNYAPYKYDLKKFNTMNSVSYDHPDPSIFTVLTSQTSQTGVANVDFVIFPERWMVAEHTFRPPYYHRNLMSEYMGLIYGSYDAKPEGFLPGGGSLHNCMSAHGPDSNACEIAMNAELKPERYQDTLAFMFETCTPWQINEDVTKDLTDNDYTNCWQPITKHYRPR